MSLFDDRPSEATNVRQEDITGKQHVFHSLPKEFQAWHNIQYMLEKKAEIDDSTVPESLLNAYMWKTISNSSKFAIPTVLGIVFGVISLKLEPNIRGLLLGLIVYIPWLIYTAYHFIFYAKIKAQVVGPVTKKCAQFTADTFYSTFSAIVISLLAVFIFAMSILQNLALLLYKLILSIETHTDSISQFIKHYMIIVYNAMIVLMNPPKHNLFSQILFNTYFATFLYVIITAATIFIFERQIFHERKSRVLEEMKKEELGKGYPIDSALLLITEWRKENGV